MPSPSVEVLEQFPSTETQSFWLRQIAIQLAQLNDTADLLAYIQSEGFGDGLDEPAESPVIGPAPQSAQVVSILEDHEEPKKNKGK